MTKKNGQIEDGKLKNDSKCCGMMNAMSGQDRAFNIPLLTNI